MLCNNNGGSCIYVSALKGHLKVVNALPKAAGPRRCELLMLTINKGDSCLYISAQQVSLAFFFFLKEGSVPATLSCGRSVAAPPCLVPEVVNALLQAAGGTARDLLMLNAEDGISCLHASVFKGHLQVLRVLVEVGGQELLMRLDREGSMLATVSDTKRRLRPMEKRRRRTTSTRRSLWLSAFRTHCQ